MTRTMNAPSPLPTQADTDRVPVVGSIVIYWFEAYRHGELVGCPGLVCATGTGDGSPDAVDLYFFSESPRLGRRGNTGYAAGAAYSAVPKVCHWSWPGSEAAR